MMSIINGTLQCLCSTLDCFYLFLDYYHLEVMINISKDLPKLSFLGLTVGASAGFTIRSYSFSSKRNMPVQYA